VAVYTAEAWIAAHFLFRSVHPRESNCDKVHPFQKDVAIRTTFAPLGEVNDESTKEMLVAVWMMAHDVLS
jgi:hypothetical protein